MLDHVLAAEASYARKIGVKHKPPAHDNTAAITSMRAAVVARIVGPPGAAPGAAPTAWPTSYVARRLAWHVLDHAWEMQDRTER
jgi:hypothetical protein